MMNQNFDNMFRSCNLNNNSTMYWMQDNERVQISDEAKNFYKLKKVKLFTGYPPNSGDINIIENIWNILKRETSKLKPNSLIDLRNKLIYTWERIDQNIIKSLVLSIPRRLSSILSNGGNHSKY